MSTNPGNGGSGTLSGDGDVALSSPATGNFLGFSTSNSKWSNQSLTGVAALANGGGVESVSTNNSATGSVTLNLNNGNVFQMTLTGNATFAFSGATSGKACSFGLYVGQDTTGGRTVTWPSSVKWAGGTAPTLTSTASAVDVLVFESLDGGTTWYGSLVGANFS